MLLPFSIYHVFGSGVELANDRCSFNLLSQVVARFRQDLEEAEGEWIELRLMAQILTH